MTESVLEKAIKIKHNLDIARGIRKNLEDKERLANGNTSEVARRRFRIQITDDTTTMKAVDISSNSALRAIQEELKNIREVEKALEKELDELN